MSRLRVLVWFYDSRKFKDGVMEKAPGSPLWILVSVVFLECTRKATLSRKDTDLVWFELTYRAILGINNRLLSSKPSIVFNFWNLELYACSFNLSPFSIRISSCSHGGQNATGHRMLWAPLSEASRVIQFRVQKARTKSEARRTWMCVLRHQQASSALFCTMPLPWWVEWCPVYMDEGGGPWLSTGTQVWSLWEPLLSCLQVSAAFWSVPFPWAPSLHPS